MTTGPSYALKPQMRTWMWCRCLQGGRHGLRQTTALNVISVDRNPTCATGLLSNERPMHQPVVTLFNTIRPAQSLCAPVDFACCMLLTLRQKIGLQGPVRPTGADNSGNRSRGHFFLQFL